MRWIRLGCRPRVAQAFPGEVVDGAPRFTSGVHSARLDQGRRPLYFFGVARPVARRRTARPGFPNQGELARRFCLRRRATVISLISTRRRVRRTTGDRAGCCPWSWRHDHRLQAHHAGTCPHRPRSCTRTRLAVRVAQPLPLLSSFRERGINLDPAPHQVRGKLDRGDENLLHSVRRSSQKMSDGLPEDGARSGLVS